MTEPYKSSSFSGSKRLALPTQHSPSSSKNVFKCRINPIHIFANSTPGFVSENVDPNTPTFASGTNRSPRLPLTVVEHVKVQPCQKKIVSSNQKTLPRCLFALQIIQVNATQVITNFKDNSTTHFMGIYMVGLVSSLSAAITYIVYIWLFNKIPSLQHFGFLCICGTFHWLPFTMIAYAIILENVPSSPFSFALLVSIGYLVHGVILCFLTSISVHFLSRLKKTQDKENSVVGSQGLILPGSNLQKDVFLGALSVAPVNSVLQQGGVFVGSQTPVMVRNTMHLLDDRIEEMDRQYKKVLGNLAANLATTTLKVNARYFHRIGAGRKGTFKDLC